jgi:xylulokinase
VTAVVGVDIGTTAVKAALVADGAVIAVVDRPLRLETPQAGWAEQDPREWWAAVVALVGEVVASMPAAVTIDALAVTGQMQDLVPVDADHQPVGPALLYADVRATREHAELQSELGAEWSTAVGFPPDATNVAAKWRWLRRNRPDVVAATATVLVGAHSYVVARATGRHVADPSTAATTGLFDLASRRWWSPVTDAVDITLPEIVESTEIAGPLTAVAAAELGLRVGLPVVHANGDAAATTVGVLGDGVGGAYVSIGTSAWSATVVADRPTSPTAIVLPELGPDRWIVTAQTPVAGAAIAWARTALLGGLGHGELDTLAASACAAAEGVLFVPHLDGARFPEPLTDATGVLVGVRRATAPATIAAAVFEGVAHAVRQLVDAIPATRDGLLLCGGATRSAALVAAVADVLGVEVSVVASDHASIVGAAVAADLALGNRPPVVDRAGRRVAPVPERNAAHRRLAPAFDAVLPTMAPVLAELARHRTSPNHQPKKEVDR